MLRMEFTQKDKEHNMYHWHPLFEKVEDVMTIYGIAVCRVHKSGGIDDYAREMYLSEAVNFKNQLDQVESTVYTGKQSLLEVYEINAIFFTYNKIIIF